MSKDSKIQWTDATWNISRGCTKVDEDCKYCYMYRDSFNKTRYDPYKVVRTKTVFNLPLKLKKPSKIFTCSLTDFFHEGNDGFRDEAWEIIRRCPQHTFQILTKRPERISQCLPDDWGEGYDNVWLGVSVGSEAGLDRINRLSNIKSKCRFVSFEPLYEDLALKVPAGILFKHYDWVIIGGESGNATGKFRYRPCEIDWLANMMLLFKGMSIPIFIKQLGTHLAKELKLKDRHGGDIEEFPPYLQVREFPKLKTK